METSKDKAIEMEEVAKSWLSYKFEEENEDRIKIVFEGLEGDNVASDVLVGLLSDMQEKFFELGKKLAKLQMGEYEWNH